MYEKIKQLRLKNNTNTIDLLRLAFTYSPEQAKQILIKINEWDKKISTLLEELTLDNRREYDLILNDLEKLRAENNEWWMQLMELAHSGFPKEYEQLISNTENYLLPMAGTKISLKIPYLKNYIPKGGGATNIHTAEIGRAHV